MSGKEQVYTFDEDGRRLPATDDARRDWQARHVVHLWRSGLLTGVVVATGAVMVTLAWYVSGGILPAGWGAYIAGAGLAGGIVGWYTAWWEDRGGYAP